jgi:glyoxylase-like metal-dependent hydrolase (beta-lactamase superfamily II)
MSAIDLGRFRLHVLSDGRFKLDGGAMFGVVPKALWQKKKSADSENRIDMGTNCLLIEAGKDLVLVDTGLGDKEDAKYRDIFAYDPAAVRLPDSLRAAGFELGDVTHVVLSHLHFDHCGWNTRLDAAGKPVATFPRARYFMNRGEVEHARQPNERDRSSYFPWNWEPLVAEGRVELFDDACEIVSGVRAVKAPGHNADLCVVTVEDPDHAANDSTARAIFLADLVPTQAHAPIGWIMGYDLFPLQSFASKRRWLERLAAENWLCIFEHDADQPLGRIVSEKPGRFSAVPL